MLLTKKDTQAAKGVAIFLFLSGYGFLKSLQRKPSTIKAISHKVLNFYKRYWSYLLKFVPRCFVLNFLLILVTMISVSCKGNSRNNAPVFFMTQEDHSRGYAYPKGHYYMYTVTAVDDPVDPQATFRSLTADGIVVREAWHRPFLTGCSPPGSGRTTTAIRSNVLIVRLDEPDDGIIKHNFKVLESPKPIACGYVVWHYVPGS
jgi:hypothetical protein